MDKGDNGTDFMNFKTLVVLFLIGEDVLDKENLFANLFEKNCLVPQGRLTHD